MKTFLKSFYPKFIKLLLIHAIALIGNNLLKAQLTSPADSLDVLHYEIRIDSIDFTETTIKATTTVTLTPLGGPVENISLELIRLTVTGVTLDGQPVTDFTQTDSLVVIPLPDPLQPGETASVSINYEGEPFHESWGGFHFSAQYAFNLGVGISTIPHNLGKSWYPCVDNFTDRATYDVFCTLPEGKMAVCGGLLTEAIDNGNGTTTWHWNLAQEVPTYLSSIAVGSYAAVNDTFTGMSGEIPINIYVRPQDTNKVEGTFVHLKEILAIFEDCMGPYSWDRVGYTGTAIGAMEHATNIFVPHNTISGNTGNEELMAHELTHMWMGDKVTCSSAEEMWINEGWATFFGMYYALALYGDEEAYRNEMRGKHASVLQFCHTTSGDGSYFPLNRIPQQYTYGMSAYDRGSTVCQALRFYLGDSLFFETLTAFIDEFAFNDASSYDIRDFMTGYTGIDMDGFFSNYVLNSGTPHYSVDSFNVAITDNSYYNVTVNVKQKRKGPAFTGDGNIMEVMFMDENWNRFYDTIHFNGQSGSSIKTIPFWPSVVLVDPEEKMCDATTDNYKIIKETGNHIFDKTFFSADIEAIPDSAFMQVTHNWAPPDSLKEHVPGLRLSDYRYWRIDGIFPENFQASGRFFYSQGNYLDNNLILSSADTVIMLYRSGAAEEWQEIGFEKIGVWNIGYLIVHNLQPGEYTLAVKEPGVGTSEATPERSKLLDIFPNPSSGHFTLITNSRDGGRVRVYSDIGALVTSVKIPEGRNEIRLDTHGFASGTYFVAFFPNARLEPEIQKIIFRGDP